MTSVLCEVRGGTAHLILDRPRALNALDTPMIRAMRTALDDWRDDDTVHTVVVHSTSPKAFCAGGDIRAVRQLVLDGRHDDAVSFFREEYALNRAIAEFPKPYIALIDGICMGGGLGISIHGATRITTERATFAMPETAIGFVPDIGSSHVLPRLPGNLGRYLALTGARLNGPDAHTAGLATHHVSSADLPALLDALDHTDPAGVDDAIAKFAGAAASTSTELREHTDEREHIDAAFADGALTDVATRLDQNSSDWARSTREKLTTASPLSLRLTDELLRRGAGDDLATCLQRELTVATNLIGHPDFAEGVRATLVDKTRDAHWTHSAPDDVPADLVDDILGEN